MTISTEVRRNAGHPWDKRAGFDLLFIKACKTPLSWSPGKRAVTPESLSVFDTIPAREER